MTNFNKSLIRSFLLMFGILFLAACANQSTATSQPSDNPQIIAINSVRAALDLPDLPLESMGLDNMTNSPSGDLPVAIYVDSEGRKFSVEPDSNTVVEMDARNLLASIPADAPIKSQADIKKWSIRVWQRRFPASRRFPKV